MEAVKDWILAIAVCAVIIEIIDMLLPPGSMRKTAFIICGLVMSICIILPATDIFNNLDNFNFDYDSEKNQIIDNREVYTEEQIMTVTSEFKNKLENHIKELANKVDGIKESEVEVIINEDYNSEKYGEILRIYIKATAGAQEQEENKNSSGFGDLGNIKKIEISIDGIKIIKNDEEQQPEESQEDERIINIKETISKEFQINADNIIVEVKDE